MEATENAKLNANSSEGGARLNASKLIEVLGNACAICSVLETANATVKPFLPRQQCRRVWAPLVESSRLTKSCRLRDGKACALCEG